MKLTDTHTGIVFANIAAVGIRNLFPRKTATEIRDNFENLADKGLGSAYFLLDPTATKRFLAFHGCGFDQDVTIENINRIDEFTPTTGNNNLTYVTGFMRALKDTDFSKKLGVRELLSTFGKEALCLAEAFSINNESNESLLDTISRQEADEEFRKTLTPEIKSAVNLDDPAFHDFIGIIASGFMSYCYKNRITPPESREKFEEIISGKSLIRLSLNTESSITEFYNWLGVNSAKEYLSRIKIQNLFDPNILDKLPLDFRQQIETLILFDQDKKFLSDQEKAFWIEKRGGKRTSSVAKAIRHEISPNTLVFNKLQELIAGNKPTIPRRKVTPITESEKGKRIVNILARGLILYCIEHDMPIPETLTEFEEGLAKISDKNNLQAALAFTDPAINAEFNIELGIPPELSHLRFDQLSEIATNTQNPYLLRSITLRQLFSTGGNDDYIKTRVRLFTELGGEDYKLITQAFGNRDCQRELVFHEMRRIVAKGEPLYSDPITIPTIDKIAKLNIIAQGIDKLNLFPDGTPKTLNQFNKAVLKQEEEKGNGFFICDDEIKQKLLYFYGYTDPSLAKLDLNELLKSATEKKDSRLLTVCVLLDALMNYDGKDIDKARTILHSGFGSPFFEGGADNLDLFNTYRRLVEYKKLSPTPPPPAPDMSLTPNGKEFVTIMAKGIIKFCETNKIPIPQTLDEFENVVVKKSRESGAQGGIAFSNPESFAEVLEWLEAPHANKLTTLGSDLFPMINDAKFPPEIRAKIQVFMLLGSNSFLYPLEERAYWINRFGGEKVKELAETFKHHDCQRRLVFEEIQNLTRS